MNQLDFSSAMAVIRYYISPDHDMNQGELLDELFYSLHAESKEPIIFDGASINRWQKGTERVSPIISRYYLKKRNSAICMDTAAIHEAMGNTYLMTGNMEQAAIQHRKCLAIYAELSLDQPDMLSAKQVDLRMLYEQVGTYIVPSIPRIA